MQCSSSCSSSALVEIVVQAHHSWCRTRSLGARSWWRRCPHLDATDGHLDRRCWHGRLLGNWCRLTLVCSIVGVLRVCHLVGALLWTNGLRLGWPSGR